ncbi:MAG: GNAT family N-acetyltransferase [Candidatus Sericytochromatia bacterium]
MSDSGSENTLSFRLIEPGEAPELAQWLAAESWPFHGNPQVEPERVLESAKQGFFWSDEARSIWILADQDIKIGFIRLFDLEDENVMFDLRLRAASRGQGVGLQAVTWLNGYVFAQFAHVYRIEGTTRVDNRAMRRTFAKAGYVRESYFRKAWSAPGLAPEQYFDAVGYALLRSDWESGIKTPVRWDDGE